MVDYNIPQNVIVMTVNGSCPSGFTAYDTVNGYYLRSAAAKDVTPAGSNTHNHAGANHTHTLSGTTGSSSISRQLGTAANLWGAPHTHTVTNIASGNPAGLTVSTVDHQPLFCSMKLCKKD